MKLVLIRSILSILLISIAHTAQAAVPLKIIKLSCNDQAMTVKLFIGKHESASDPLQALVYLKTPHGMKLYTTVSVNEGKQRLDANNTQYHFSGDDFLFSIKLFKYPLSAVRGELNVMGPNRARLPSDVLCNVDYQNIDQ